MSKVSINQNEKIDDVKLNNLLNDALS